MPKRLSIKRSNMKQFSQNIIEPLYIFYIRIIGTSTNLMFTFIRKLDSGLITDQRLVAADDVLGGVFDDDAVDFKFVNFKK